MLSQEKKLCCEIIRDHGVPVAEIARQLRRSRSTGQVYETLQRLQETGSRAPKPKSGRSQVSNVRTYRLLARTYPQNRKLTVPAPRLVRQEAGVNASNSTVRR
ncbi:uncharacterized protein LOC132728998 [Ruditapes philippinarum]|uniref:uncharacterized protein LOC132728998 n=1 Tax=Ruditapes philippinarum TaxID=129788 RepID=UPI00295BD8EE|nr:uncharacterized protein LOC132728998 [Ruditapes philippinarum]